MGQSMQKPNRSTLRNANSRLSARSLQRSSNHSLMYEKRNSMSASKLKQINQEENVGSSVTQENTQIRNGELYIVSKYEEAPATIKQSNKLKIQRGSIGTQNSQLSPNFREIAETGAEYGLGQWGATNISKQSMEASHNDAHHDITISFSKTKNFNNNIFHEENQDRRSTLKQILEFEEESQNEKNHEVPMVLQNTENQKYLDKEIDKISAIRSIYSDNYNKTPSPTNTPPEDGTPKKIRNSYKKQEVTEDKAKTSPSSQKLLSSSVKEKSKIPINDSNTLNHSQYNDYDCADFRRKIKDGENSGRKAVRMSKKMEELKQKIANKASKSKDKQQILKGSIQRLSKSLRKFKEGHSLESKSREESKEKLKPVLSKVQCLDIKIESKAEEKQILRQTSKKVQQNVKASKSPRQSIVQEKNPKSKNLTLQQNYLTKVRSSEQLGKTTISSQNSHSKVSKNSKGPSQLLAFNNGNTYLQQNLCIQNDKNINQPRDSTKKLETSKVKEQSFTEMVKKEHFGNKFKRRGGQKIVEECLKYSQVQKGVASPVNEQFFASTCEGNKFVPSQQYEFFDVRESKRAKQSNSRIHKQQINSLKLITQQLTSNQRKSKLKVTLQEQSQSHHSSSQEQSIRNKTYQQKSSSIDRLPVNLTALNYTELIGNYEQYMLRDALNRQKEGQQWVKQQKKKHKSSQHSSKMAGVKSRLLVF